MPRYYDANVDTMSDGPKDIYNAALAEILRARKNEKRLTFDELSEASGIKLRTLKRLINGEAELSFDQMVALGISLDLDVPAIIHDAIVAAEKTSSQSPPQSFTS